MLDAVSWRRALTESSGFSPTWTRRLLVTAKRVAAGEISPSAYDDWMQQERPFQADQETWIRAHQIVCGSPAEELPAGCVLVGKLSTPVSTA